MKLSKWLCPWCEVRPLQYMDGYMSSGHGLSSVSGIKLACSNPVANNCPDTTGLCKTEAEADAYASELCIEAADGIKERAMSNPSPFDYKAYIAHHGNPLHALIPGHQKSVWMARVIEQARETQPSYGTMYGISNKETSVTPKQFMKRPAK